MSRLLRISLIILLFSGGNFFLVSCDNEDECHRLKAEMEQLAARARLMRDCLERDPKHRECRKSYDNEALYYKEVLNRYKELDCEKTTGTPAEIPDVDPLETQF